MKKLKITKKIQTATSLFQETMNIYCDKINREYAKNINKLINNIANGENIDVKILKEKYLKTLDIDIDINKINEDDNDTEIISEEIVSEEIIPDEIVFDKIVIDGNNYYYENKENGKIYNSNSKIVGVYKDKKHIIN